jgi:replicative DNA helicase
MDAEHQLLTNAIHRRESLENLLELGADYFFSKGTAEVFQIIADLVYNDIEISLTTLLDVGRERELVLKIYNNMSTYDDKPLINILKRERFKRLGMMVMKDAINIMSKGGNIDEQLQRLIDLYDETHSTKEKLGGYVAELAKEEIDTLIKNNNYLTTGISNLDTMLTGLFPGQLVVIAAAPGSGKTTIALQIADKINEAVFYSYEMTKKQLYIKMLASHSGVDSFKITGGRISDVEREKLDKARIVIKDRCKLKIGEPLQFIQLLHDMKSQVRNGAKLIVIDYLQLIVGSTGENQEQKLAKITRGLKLFALENKVPVVLLSQLTKDILKEQKAPTLGHLRGSGAIGQDADTVLFLWVQNERTRLLIAKAREGRPGDIDGIEFEKEYSRFICNTATSWENARQLQQDWWQK